MPNPENPKVGQPWYRSYVVNPFIYFSLLRKIEKMEAEWRENEGASTLLSDEIIKLRSQIMDEYKKFPCGTPYFSNLLVKKKHSTNEIIWILYNNLFEYDWRGITKNWNTGQEFTLEQIEAYNSAEDFLKDHPMEVV